MSQEVDVLHVGDGVLGAGASMELYDWVDEAGYPDDKERAWFYTIVPDPHRLPSGANWPSSVWFQILRTWSGLWTDFNDPAHKGSLSRCVGFKNIGSSEAAYHVLLAISNV